MRFLVDGREVDILMAKGKLIAVRLMTMRLIAVRRLIS